MTPRSKIRNEKSDWFECLNCRLIVSSKDLILHNDSCGKVDLKNLQGLSTSLNLEAGHGFIINETLFALHCVLASKDDALKDVPQLTRKSLVFIHPSAMKFCKIGIGDHVFVRGGDFEFLGKAWPSLSVNPASIYIVNHPTKVKKIVAVQLYKRHISDAVDVLVNFNDEVASSDRATLLKQLLIQNNYMTITPGQVLNCNFFGNNVGATIVSVSDGIQVHEKIPVKSQGIETLSENLADLMNKLDLSVDSQSATNSTDAFRLESPRSPQDPLKNYRCAVPTKNNSNSTTSEVYFTVMPDTKMDVCTQEASPGHGSICYDSVGGLDKELNLLRNQIDLFFKKSDCLSGYGIAPPRGVLLYGSPGTGKSFVLEALSNEVPNINVMPLKASEMFSKFYGETEQKLKECFDTAVKRAPCILTIDEIDLICGKGGENQSTDLERRILSALLALIDNLHFNKLRVFIIATTNKVDDLNLALRQPGRIDKEIEISVPNSEGRFDIVRKQLRSIPHELSDSEIRSVTENLHSFNGADLASLIREAGEIAMRENDNERPKITMSNLMEASPKIKPTAMKEVTIEVPKVLWSDIGGMKKVKHRLKQAIEWPLKHPDAFKRLGVRPPRGLLMYGPPGCSKTMVAKALATESGLNFLAIKGPELFNKWVGESERAVRELFRKAKAAAPSIIFFDEIDALAGERGSSTGGSNVGNRVLAQILTEMDGIELLEGVTIIAATNRPDMIDKALLRPGRLDSIVYVPLPDDESRREIFQIQFKKMPISSNVITEDLIRATDGYSGAEIVALCQEAGLAALAESLDTKEIQWEHFIKALDYVKPRISKETLEFYVKYYNQNSVGSKKMELNCDN